ncbi:MAG: hypothetical protein P8O74_01640 [Paracoccaceae bacterium]|nr:hypothetical protein [Paracoccaceae bacterium]
MKHEVINTPSTHNVLRMMFECKTFDEQNEEKSIRRFETKVKVKTPQFQNPSFQKEPLKAVSI